jgi:hypothetical protein
MVSLTTYIVKLDPRLFLPNSQSMAWRSLNDALGDKLRYGVEKG